MEAAIIKVGNSRGLRLSKSILEQYNFKDKVEMVLEKNQIILRSIDEPRKNWDAAFKQMNLAGDDNLAIDDVFADENFEEWY